MQGGDAHSFQPVKSRLVLFFPGFEPLGPQAHRDRFERAAHKTGPHFNARFECGPLQQRPSGLSGFSVAASGESWSTRTDVVIFDWSQILRGYSDRPLITRLAAGIFALLSFMFNGTLLKYLAVSWRYGFFFFFPFVLLLAVVITGLSTAYMASWFGGGIALSWLVGLSFFACTLLLTVRRTHLLLLMDDWAFAADIAYSRNPAIIALQSNLAAALSKEFANSPHDEILTFGHSLGCVFAVDLLASAAPASARSLNLMTAGSSLLKIALHPAAAWLRTRIATLTTTETQWLDVQSLTDAISFYKSNPAASAGIETGLRPRTLEIRFRNMMSEKSFAKSRYNPFRTHRQFVLAAEKPYAYSMHMIVSGPVPFEQVWSDTGFPFDNAAFVRQPRL